MKSRFALRLATAAGVLGLWACSKDSTSPSASLIDQTTITSDVASSSGDAIAADVQTVSANESFAGLSASAAVNGDSISYTWTRTCFDSTGTSVACGSSVVRKAALFVSFSWSRNDVAADGAVFTGNVKRVANDTLFRNFTGATETSRTHDGNSAGSDTTTFTGPKVTRTYDEAGTDSIEAVTYDLPRSTNPFPISGKIVRNVSVHATFQNATRADTTDVTRRVEVDFPPDNQGNVVLTINGKTCNLNLVTRRVTNCQ